MPGAIYICGGDDVCPRHGKFIYFCNKCHLEWEEANPNTVKAIRQPKCSPSSLATAKKKDAELRKSTAVQNPGDNDGD